MSHAEVGYRPGDVVDGHQWSGEAWVETPSFPDGPAMAPPADQRRWFGRPWIALMGSILAAIVVISALSVGDEKVDRTAATDVQGADAQRAPVPQVPQIEPTALPTTFQPIVLQGSGDSIQRITVPPIDASQVIVAAEHAGSGNFIVWGMDAELQQTELAINDSGVYRGAAVVAATTAALEVTADGPWTITVKPLADAPTFDATISGTDSQVVRYTGRQGLAVLTHVGPGAFAVWESIDGQPPKLVVVEDGDYTGQLAIGAGPNVLVIESDGEWTVSVG